MLWLLLPEARTYFVEVCPSLSQRFPLCAPPVRKRHNCSFNGKYRTRFYLGQESGQILWDCHHRSQMYRKYLFAILNQDIIKLLHQMSVDGLPSMDVLELQEHFECSS